MMLFDSISGGIKSAVESRSVAGQPAGKSLTEVVDCFLSLCKWKHRGQNEAGFSVLSPVYRTYSCCICINVFLYVCVLLHAQKKSEESESSVSCQPHDFLLYFLRSLSKKTDYLKNGQKQKNPFTVYSAATATGLQK